MYIQPIHLLKKYYGEKFAFYFVYFMHYQGQLILPSILGILLFSYQMYWYATVKNMQLALDTSMNGVYGVFLAIWASVFVESWKDKQKRLIFEWDLNSVKDILNNDERKG